jgi:hypothetical protein
LSQRLNYQRLIVSKNRTLRYPALALNANNI